MAYTVLECNILTNLCNLRFTKGWEDFALHICSATIPPSAIAKLIQRRAFLEFRAFQILLYCRGESMGTMSGGTSIDARGYMDEKEKKKKS